MSALRVTSAHHIAYAPQYVAAALGFFRAEGLDVVLEPAPAGDAAIVDLLVAEKADLVLGSMLFVLRLRQAGLSPVLVAQSNQQARHWLLARSAPSRPFAWGDLAGRSVLVHPDRVPTPWAAFRQALRQHGVPLDDIHLIIGFGPEQASAAFKGGTGDYLLADPEAADIAGLARVATVADALGPVPWSLYCTLPALAAARAPDMTAFARAIDRAVAWIYAHGAAEIAAAIAGLFPGRTSDDLVGSIARGQEARIWFTGIRTPPDHLARWTDALRLGGLLAGDVALSDLPWLAAAPGEP